MEELEYYGREQQRKRNLEKGIARNKNVEREKNNNKAIPRILMSKIKGEKIKRTKEREQKSGGGK